MKILLLRNLLLLGSGLSSIIGNTASASPLVSASYYTDERDFNTLTLQLTSNDMPYGFSVWGFTDFHSDHNNNKERKDLTRSFSEYRLSNSLLADWADIKGLGLQVEYNDTTPNVNNAVWRGGITYKQGLGEKRWMQLRWLPLQNNEDSQVSLIYFLPLHERLNLTGFADYNIRDNKKNQWVAEPQLEFRLQERTWLLFEHRYNGFERDNATLDGTAWAVGLRYHL